MDAEEGLAERACMMWTAGRLLSALLSELPSSEDPLSELQSSKSPACKVTCLTQGHGGDMLHEA